MQYKCSVCGYIYDDAKEKTPFAELPDSWRCPLCGAPKSAFLPVATEPKTKEKVIPTLQITEIDEDMQKLSAGQTAALFSNLARGCEKQYKVEEARLFREIAAYFTAATPSPKDASFDALTSLLTSDLAENYPYAKAAAEGDGDRGAQRICVWGEKVTRMLYALAERYRTEGDAMMANTEIWVCTVCGFVYIGENPPSLCPVCKVPSWKFEKIEGRN